MVQAQTFATYLAPPVQAVALVDSMPVTSRPPRIPPRRPAAPSATLRVHATSCYPDRPKESMALVSAVNAEPQEPRWVKEGIQFGPFVIHEIRRGEVVYRLDGSLHQAVLNHNAERPSLVRDLRHDLPRGPVALDGTVGGSPIVVGPNDIDFSRN